MSALKAIGLTSPTTQVSGRFFFGEAFAEGALPAGNYPHLDTPVYSSYIVNRWPDGSARLVTFAGSASFTANVEKHVNIVSRSYPPGPSTGTALTAADIATSGAAASVQFGGLGTVTLAGAVLVDTHYSDAQMVCCEYRKKLGTTGLSVQFFVFLFADGTRFVRVTPWNGFFLDGSTQRDYVPTVTIDGIVVYSNGGSTFHHSPNTWYTFTRWSNGSASIRPRHDTANLIASGMPPNFTFDTPQSANTTYLSSISTYTPGSNGHYSPSMPDTGAHDDIGMLPMWEAMYFVQRAEAVAYDALIANAQSIGAYAVFHCDPNTYRPIKISSYPTHTQYGPNGGGGPLYASIAQDNTTQYIFEIAHHPSCGFLAAMVTGDPFYMQISQYVANACYLALPQQAGSGTDRVLNGQDRQVGWSIRSISQAAALCPTSQASYYDHAAWYKTQAAAYSDFADGISGVGGFKVGMMNTYTNYGNITNGTGVGFWQEDFVMAAIGQALLMKVGDATARIKALNFLAYLSNSVAWRTAASFFTYGANYFHYIPRTVAQNPDIGLLAADATPASAADIWNINLDSAQLATLGDNTLHAGGSTGLGAGSYWDQLFTANAYCCTFNLPGASAGRARIVGATNFSSTLGSDSRATNPVFAISPTSVTHTPTFTAVDTGGLVPVPGPTLTLDSVSLAGAGKLVLSAYRGNGIPLSVIASTGSDGASLAYPMIEGTDDLTNELAVSVVSPTSHGPFVFDDKLSSIYSGDGTADSIALQWMYRGVPHGDPTVYTLGGVPPAATVTSITASPSAANLAGGASVQINVTVAGLNNPSQSGTWNKVSGVGTVSAGLITAPAATSSQQTGLFRFISTQDANYHVDVVLTVAALVPAGDTTRPVMVGAITSSAVTSSSFTMSCQAATDNVGVVDYQWRIDGGALQSTGLTRSKSYSGLAAESSHAVEVFAVDAAGNAALVPLTLTVVTLAASTGPVLTDRVLVITLKSKDLVLRPNLSGIYWEWSDARGVVTSSGNGIASNGSGQISVPIRTSLLSDAVGFLSLDNYNGGNPLDYFAFRGPVRLP